MFWEDVNCMMVLSRNLIAFHSFFFHSPFTWRGLKRIENFLAKVIVHNLNMFHLMRYRRSTDFLCSILFYANTCVLKIVLEMFAHPVNLFRKLYYQVFSSV